MPSLFRFLFVLAVLAGFAYAAMISLVFIVEPKTREMTERVDLSKIGIATPPGQ